MSVNVVYRCCWNLTQCSIATLSSCASRTDRLVFRRHRTSLYQTSVIPHPRSRIVHRQMTQTNLLSEVISLELDSEPSQIPSPF